MSSKPFDNTIAPSLLSSIISSIIPSISHLYDLGSNIFYFRKIYCNDITIATTSSTGKINGVKLLSVQIINLFDYMSLYKMKFMSTYPDPPHEDGLVYCDYNFNLLFSYNGVWKQLSFDPSLYYTNTEIDGLLTSYSTLSANNTFTGANNFNNVSNSIQATTQVVTNSSNYVATTEFVQKNTGFTTLIYSGSVTIPLQTTMNIFIHYTGTAGVAYIGIGSHQTPEYKGQTYVVTSFSIRAVVFYPGGTGSFVVGGGARTDISLGITVAAYTTKTFIYTGDSVHSWIYY